MKKAGVVIAAILCVGLLCGGFFIVRQKVIEEQQKEVVLTEVQKIITKDLEEKYPATPREVVKMYNRIITAYYKEEYTDKEFDQLTNQALCLFDKELLEINPKEVYAASVRVDIDDYKERKRYIASSDVCDSDEVMKLKDKDDDIAYVTASYFVREGTDYSKTYQMYVLRKDDDGKWKILVFYQIEAPES